MQQGSCRNLLDPSLPGEWVREGTCVTQALWLYLPVAPLGLPWPAEWVSPFPSLNLSFPIYKIASAMLVWRVEDKE